MKQATCIVTYYEAYDKDGIKFYCLMNISAVTRDNHLVTLLQYGKSDLDTEIMYKYYGFHSMYDDVLNILKSNGLYAKSYDDFGRRWYDIQFIEYHEPWDIKRFYHSWR